MPGEGEPPDTAAEASRPRRPDLFTHRCDPQGRQIANVAKYGATQKGPTVDDVHLSLPFGSLARA